MVVETGKWTQQRMAFFSSHDKITAVREFVQMAFALLYGAGRGHGSARLAWLARALECSHRIDRFEITHRRI